MNYIKNLLERLLAVSGSPIWLSPDEVNFIRSEILSCMDSAITTLSRNNNLVIFYIDWELQKLDNGFIVDIADDGRVSYQKIVNLSLACGSDKITAMNRMISDLAKEKGEKAGCKDLQKICHRMLDNPNTIEWLDLSTVSHLNSRITGRKIASPAIITIDIDQKDFLIIPINASAGTIVWESVRVIDLRNINNDYSVIVCPEVDLKDRVTDKTMERISELVISAVKV